MTSLKLLPLSLAIVAILCARPGVTHADWQIAWRGLRDANTLLSLTSRYEASDIDEFSVTPTGEWILIATKDGHHYVEHSAGFPEDILTWVHNYLATGRTIDAVAISPTGGWVVIAQDYLRRTSWGISESKRLRDVFDSYVAQGIRVDDLAFDSDGDGWALVAAGKVYARHMPTDLYNAALDCAEGNRQVRQITVAPDGRWLLTSDNWYAGKGVPPVLRHYLAQWQRQGALFAQLALTPDKVGFFATSDELSTLDLNDPLNQMEGTLISGNSNRTIWERIQDNHVAGVSLATMRHGRVVSARGYGLLEAGTERWVRPSSLFDTASISKSMSAALTLSLVDRQLIDLDESLVDLAYDGSRVLPDNDLQRWIEYGDDNLSKPISRDLTIRHLLSHGADLDPHGSTAIPASASLPNTYEMLRGYRCSSPSSCALDDGSTVQTPTGSTATPGDAGAYGYSGGGFLVLQAVIEAIIEGSTGQTFDEAMSELIFDPTGMDRSTFVQPIAGQFSGQFMLEHDDSGALRPSSQRLIYPWKTAGGLFSTASDLGYFVAMLSERGENAWGQRTLEPESVEQMMTRQRDNAGDLAMVLNAPYGLGLELSFCNVGWTNFHLDPRPARVSHGGVHRNVRTRMIYNPETEEGLVILVAGGSAGTLSLEIERAFIAAAGWSPTVNDPLHCSDPQASPWSPKIDMGWDRVFDRLGRPEFLGLAAE